MVQRRLDGLNPFSNIDRVYAGSHDDAALNAGVQRFAADSMGVARLAYDADLSGLIVAPTITIHGKADPTAFVSNEAVYRDRVASAGRSDLLVQTFTDEAEAIRLANDTAYGLAASVYTENVHRANRVARAIRAGTVSINGFSEGDITTPFGGYKLSGFGGRDNGFEALDQYLETKTIWYVNRDGR